MLPLANIKIYNYVFSAKNEFVGRLLRKHGISLWPFKQLHQSCQVFLKTVATDPNYIDVLSVILS
jgi:hypothetical protein